MCNQKNNMSMHCVWVTLRIYKALYFKSFKTSRYSHRWMTVKQLELQERKRDRGREKHLNCKILWVAPKPGAAVSPRPLGLCPHLLCPSPSLPHSASPKPPDPCPPLSVPASSIVLFFVPPSLSLPIHPSA